MKTEVSSAAGYVVDELRKRRGVGEEKLTTFRSSLERLLCDRFVDHWHPSAPMKGNAFRCLNIEHDFVDPVLVRAAQESGLISKDLVDSFPKGLALWVDPNDVACRSGRGPIQPIYKRIHKSRSPVTVLPNATLDQNKESMKAALKFNPWEAPTTNAKIHRVEPQQRYITNNTTTTFFKPFFNNNSASWKKPSLKKSHQLQYTGQDFVPNANRHWSQSTASYQGGYGEFRSQPQMVY